MTPAARIAAAVQVLDACLAGEPATRALLTWSRASRFAGSGDRNAVRDLVYTALRRRRSAAARGGAETGRGLMLGLLREAGEDPDTLFTGKGHAPPPLTDTERQAWRQPEGEGEACDLPDWLVGEFRESLAERWRETALALRDRAPVFLRANFRKTDLDEAVAALSSDGVSTEPHPLAPGALVVTEGARRVAQSRAYRDGLVELQDGASQAVTASIPLHNGMKVLDYCAGGGGKTLSMASGREATFFCHDVDVRRMADLPERARRAGVRVTLLETAEVARHAPFDVVLCDAPCSGSGSWRRDPEGKWALTESRLADLTAIQDGILDAASALVAPEGLLAYATCSFLNAENEARVKAFLNRNPGWTCVLQRRFGPGDGGDGFFTAHLTRGPQAADT